MKETLIFIYELLFFTFISVPLAIFLFVTANIYFELKRLYNGFRTRA